MERCVERVSQLYEQGVDLVRIGTYVRRWLRWARSGLRPLGEELLVRGLVLIGRSLGLAGPSYWPLPSLRTGGSCAIGT